MTLAHIARMIVILGVPILGGGDQGGLSHVRRDNWGRGCGAVGRTETSTCLRVQCYKHGRIGDAGSVIGASWPRRVCDTRGDARLFMSAQLSLPRNEDRNALMW